MTAERPKLVTIVQPVTFGLAVLLSRFVSWPTSPESLMRPTVVVVVFAIAALLLARAITRSWTWAAVLSSALVMFTMREAIPGLILAAVGLWWLLVLALRRAQGRQPPVSIVPQFVARASGYFSLAFLAIMAFSAWQAYASGMVDFAAPDYDSAGVGGPNIYLMLLDGYPRADTLEDVFSFNNQPFTDELGTLGFNVSTTARSNYNKTWPALASVLNGSYLDVMLEGQTILTDRETQVRWLHAMIDEASMLDVLRERGYVIRTAPSPFASTSLTSADDYRSAGHFTEFEARLIWNTPWMSVAREPLTSFLLAEQERVVRDNVELTAQMAENHGDAPQFVFAHVHAPHTPFTLNPDDSFEPTMPRCFPLRCSLWHAPLEALGMDLDTYGDGLRNQIAVLNDLVLQSIKRVVRADPEAIVIIMSDHGARYSLAETDEHFRTLLAARTPGHPGLYPDDESSVNVLRRVFNAYLDVDVDPLPYRSWEVDWHYNLVLTPRTGTTQDPITLGAASPKHEERKPLSPDSASASN